MSDAPLRVGVLAVQGAVSEHEDALQRAAAAAGLAVEVVAVRTPDALAGVTGLILPGGESTTISRLLRTAELQEPLRERAAAGELALFGTCAGMILLAQRAEDEAQVAKKDIELLGLLEAEVDRNAFGRQRESFEADLDVNGWSLPLPAVFIRAPRFTKVWGDTQALAEAGGGAVLVQRGRIMAAAFHPELTPDTRLHERFLALAAEAAAAAAVRPAPTA
ncbi:MAG: pyridoxal 5'-phosphate synthase glutaminase subunit PdxT [Thermoplasmatota archaeon]